MTISRASQISLDETPFYHCYVRCVRRAYLCGTDDETGNSYEHRKQWLVSRIRYLSYVFAIDVCAYAVMSNHYHVVLHADKNRASDWSLQEVVERWKQLYKGHVLIDRWQQNRKAMSAAEQEQAEKIIESWRERLYDISWFMRSINEKIARMANEEDNTKGRFWEGRFKSQALLDEAAVLSCMAYVDLNPVRAGITDNLIDSDFTSIQQRIAEFAGSKQVKNIEASTKKKIREKTKAQDKLKKDLKLDELPAEPLMPFSGSSNSNIHSAPPFTHEDYLELVDSTGRAIRTDKRGAISQHSAKLLAQLGIDSNKWIEHVCYFGRRHAHCAGSPDNIADFANRFNCKWGKGTGFSKQVYKSCA